MEEVRNWLRGLGLGQYAHKFEEDGWDSLEMLQHMHPNEIEACIDKPGHRRKFEIGIKSHFPKGKSSGDAGDGGSILKEENTKETSANIVTRTESVTNADETRTEESKVNIKTPDSSERVHTTDETETTTNTTDVSERLQTDETEIQTQTTDTAERAQNGATESIIHTYGDSERSHTTETEDSDNSERAHAKRHIKVTEMENTVGRETSLNMSDNSEGVHTDEPKTRNPTNSAERTQTDESETHTCEPDGSDRTQNDESVTSRNIPDSLKWVQTDECSNDFAVRDNESEKATDVCSNLIISESISKEDITSQLPLNTQHDILTTVQTDSDLTNLDHFGRTTSNDQICLSETSISVANRGREPPVYTETLCVKGARNKMILPAVPTDSSSLARGVEPKHKQNKAQLVATGVLAVKSQRMRTSDDDLSSETASSSASDSENDEMKTMASVKEMRTGHQLLARNAAQPVKKATIVSDSKNVTIAHRAEVHHHHHKPPKRKARDNFKDQIANVVESFKRKDHLFVETKASTEVEDIINDRHWALITGKPGDGKTSMAAHLMLKYQKQGFEPILLTNAHDWKVLVKGESDDNKAEKQFVMIDDMFGSMNADDRKVNEWVSIMDVMQRLIKERKGSLVVVCTSRAHVFKDVKTNFEKFSCFPNAACVDMTQKMYELTFEEKWKMWKIYTEEYKVKSRVPSCVYSSVILPHGFPHCVELYCSNQFLREQGLAFFENPMQYICKEILNFKENDKIKFCLLLLVLFNGNKLEESVLQHICLSDPPKEVIKIFKAAGLSSDHAQSELKKALGSLRNTYIYEELDNSYRFSHESIRENVAFMYIKDNPLHAIEEIDLKYLVDHTRCHGQTSKGQENIFVLPAFATNALVERLVKEIERGQIELVCQHQAWSDHVFIRKFLDYILIRSKESKRRVDYIHKLLFTRQAPTLSSLYLTLQKELNLLEMLMYSKQITALTHILQNVEIRTLLKSQESIRSLSQTFVCACFLMPDSHIISTLLQMGADINTVLTDKDVCRYYQLYEYAHRIWMRSLYKNYNSLLCAVVTRNTSLVALLMDKGGSVYIGEEPVALIAAVELDLPDILKVILEKTRHLMSLRNESIEGCDTQCDSKQDEGHTVAIWNCKCIRYVRSLNCSCVLSLVHVAKSTETLKELVKAGARVNEDVIVSGTRMPHCIFRMLSGLDAEYFHTLLQAGMIATGSWMGNTCLHFCMKRLPLLKFTGFSPFDSVMATENYECIQKAKIQTCWNLLKHLISQHSVNNLLNQVDRYGNSALHYLLQVQLTDCIILPIVQRDIFNEMISLGANINLPNKEGVTPVMNALSRCSDVYILLACIHRRTPILLDDKGRGYYHFLANSALPRDKVFEIVKMLLESGENINLQDKAGNIAAFQCNYETLFAFRMAGARIDIANNSKQNIISVNLMKGITKEICDIYDIARHVVPDINATDKAGRTPMHCLMSASTDGFYRFKYIYDSLVSAGSDPERPDKNGVTPLMLAAGNPTVNELILTFLVDQGLDFSGTDSCGMTVLHYLSKSKTNFSLQQTKLRLLLQHFPNLFETGHAILQYAINELACRPSFVLELFLYKYKRYNETDYSREILELLMSSRSADEKCSVMQQLYFEIQIHFPFTRILLNDALPKGTKEDVVMMFLNEKVEMLEDIAHNEENLVKMLSGMNDDSALKILTHVENRANLKCVLSSFHLETFLCKQNFPKSLLFVLSVRSNLSDQDDDGNTIIQKMIECVTDDDCLADLVNIAIMGKADISHQNKELMTALHIACKLKPLKQKTTYLLLEHMDNIDQPDCRKTTALQYLCSNQKNQASKSSETFDVQLYLALCFIERGADVDHQNMHGQTVIMSAIHERLQHESLINLLIENSKDINIQDVYGNTVLHYLAKSSVSDDLKALIIDSILKKGGDITIKNNSGETCIDIYRKLVSRGLVGVQVLATLVPHVIIGSQIEILEILFSSLTVFSDDRKESFDKMKDIVVKRNIQINNVHTENWITLLMAASESVLPDAVRALLTMKANPNVRDMIGCTCLTRLLCSVKVKYMSILHACYVGGDIYKEFALQVGGFFWNDVGTNEFLQAVAAAEIRYSAGNRECFNAVKQVNSKALDVLQTLLSAGADPNILDISGKSPLHHYVQSPLADIFICPAIKLLLDYGANVNAEDFEGMTPLMACLQFAGRKSKRLNILIAAGANINAVDDHGRDAVEYGKMAFFRMQGIHRK